MIIDIVILTLIKKLNNSFGIKFACIIMETTLSSSKTMYQEMFKACEVMVTAQLTILTQNNIIHGWRNDNIIPNPLSLIHYKKNENELWLQFKDRLNLIEIEMTITPNTNGHVKFINIIKLLKENIQLQTSYKNGDTFLYYRFKNENGWLLSNYKHLLLNNTILHQN